MTSSVALLVVQLSQLMIMKYEYANQLFIVVIFLIGQIHTTKSRYKNQVDEY